MANLEDPNIVQWLNSIVEMCNANLAPKESSESKETKKRKRSVSPARERSMARGYESAREKSPTGGRSVASEKDYPRYPTESDTKYYKRVISRLIHENKDRRKDNAVLIRDLNAKQAQLSAFKNDLYRANITIDKMKRTIDHEKKKYKMLYESVERGTFKTEHCWYYKNRGCCLNESRCPYVHIN